MTARYRFSVVTGTGHKLTRNSCDDYGYEFAAFAQKPDGTWRVAYSKTRDGAIKNLGDYWADKPNYGVGPVTKEEIPRRVKKVA